MSDTAKNARFVRHGAARFKLAQVDRHRDIYFLLLPRMTMLAFSAAIEPLRIANQLTGQCLYRWFLMTEDGQPVSCSNGISIQVDEPLRDLDRADTAFVCSGLDAHLAASPRVLAWVRSHARHGGEVGGLCTGAFSLARAGLLDGKRFTLHWENQPAFAEKFPDLPISDALFVRDGRIVTCGGGDAPIDLMISLIQDHHGEDLARMVSDMCLHGGRRSDTRPQRVSVAMSIGSRHPALVRIIKAMSCQLTTGDALSDLIQDEKISRRQVERLFKAHLGVTPARYFKNLKLDRAHALLIETNMTITDIALSSGFESLCAFRDSYRKRFGNLPRDNHRKESA